MERKQFIKSCAFACLAGTSMVTVLQSCTSTKGISGSSISATITGSELIVPIAAFVASDGKFKKYVVANHDSLQFPICIYRFNESEYTALLMKCTHQGAELQVFGDKLQCPAHGSEFSNKGIVENSPADTNLRTFPISITQTELRILLQ